MLEVFDIFVEMFGDPRVPQDDWERPELSRQLHDRVRKWNFNNGHQKIEFKNGGFIRFVSRATARAEAAPSTSTSTTRPSTSPTSR